MAQIHSIETLYQRGWSQRRIARELSLDRGTVRRYIQRLHSLVGASEISPKPAIPTPGRNSHCSPYHDFIEEKLEEGLSAERIYSDLREERGFEHSYSSVKRYVRRLKAQHPKRIWRMECRPGEEAQVDFGFARTLLGPGGKHCLSNVLRVTLSCSRKGYTETLSAQSTDQFITALENAFLHFGGVPATLRIDNLRAAVTRADWYDPDVHPKILAFARHYGLTVIPTRPYTPQHKGKVESDVKYVKNNALKGRQFNDIAAQNVHLRDWEANVADKRIHGTTRQQVGKHFQQVERPALKRLPPERFPNFHEGQRTVHRDSYVEIERAYYEVPPEYIGHRIWARWDVRLMRLYDAHMRPINQHVRLAPGKYSRFLGARGTDPTDPKRTNAHWLGKVEEQCERATQRWALAVSVHRPEQAPRILQGLLALHQRHTAKSIDEACQRALKRTHYHLSHIRDTLKSPETDSQNAYLSEHPVIRPLSAYHRLIKVDFENRSSS